VWTIKKPKELKSQREHHTIPEIRFRSLWVSSRWSGLVYQTILNINNLCGTKSFSTNSKWPTNQRYRHKLRNWRHDGKWIFQTNSNKHTYLGGVLDKKEDFLFFLQVQITYKIINFMWTFGANLHSKYSYLIIYHFSFAFLFFAFFSWLFFSISYSV
jgi:hypothetical protein